MVRLLIHKDARGLGIRNPVACLISQVSISTDSAYYDLEQDINDLVETLTVNPDAILTRPEVQGFKTLFGRMGYVDQLPAGHRLIQSFQQRGFKRYNNVIDAYNIASARFGSGLGMHDASIFVAAGAALEVFRATGAEQITPIFKTKAATVKPGDLVYGFRGETLRLMAWLGKKDVDSDHFKVTGDTHELLLVALGNEHTTEGYNRDACNMAASLIAKSCPGLQSQFLPVAVLA